MNLKEQHILYGTVFLTGAVVLVLEVAAVRLLSPYFGTSLYVVSSVLTTVLAALSLGYYWGGRLADRYADPLLLYTLIAAAGLLINFLYLLSGLVLPLGSILLPITYGPLVVSLLLFFVPAFLLGIDSPFVIKLLSRTHHADVQGSVVGNTFFWSTVGSIVGSLLTGFLLVPLFGLKLTIVGAATTLTLMATVLFLYFQAAADKESNGRMYTRYVSVFTLLSCLFAALALWADLSVPRDGALVYRTEGFYAPIEVREVFLTPTKRARYLIRGTNYSSGVLLGSDQLVFQYVEYARTYRELLPEAESFLQIGGGAYTIPRMVLREESDMTVDVVEIEPKLHKLAQRFFELPDSPRLTNHVMDARVFLNTNEKQFDVVYLDTFESGLFIPPHLVTQEFFTDIKDTLSADGLFIANVLGTGPEATATLTGSILKTAQTVFPNLRVYIASDNTAGLHNLVLMAHKDDTPAELSDSFAVGLSGYTQHKASDRIIELESYHLHTQKVLTDNLAPTELLLAQQIFKYQ